MIMENETEPLESAIGERVRMLGGTFEIDSTPGGPTMLTFALPRVTPDERSAFR